MTKHLLAALGLLAATPAVAQDGGAVCRSGDRLLNSPGANWTAYGKYKGKWIKDTGREETPEAWQVAVEKSSNAYDTAGNSPLMKPIAAGDTVLVDLWMRAPNLKPGETTPVPFFGVGEAESPYAAIASGTAAVGPEWQLFHAAGKAPKAFKVGAARANVHLAAAKHVIELGAIIIYDCGKDQDPAKLVG
jgi:hypothetical protein